MENGGYGKLLVMVMAVFAIAFGSVSCQMMRHQPMSAAEMDRRSVALESALLGLRGVDAASEVVSAEAALIARVCVVEGEAFAQKYQAVRPSWWNNCLVNLGIHEWGLCWHYQHYLYAQLYPHPLRHFKVHCGGRDKGRKFHEHNCVVIVPVGGEFHDGLVIDPWKESGRTIWFATRGEDGDWIDEPHWADWLDRQLETD